MVPDHTKEEYTARLVELWNDLVRTVYLKEPGGHATQMAEQAWAHTRMTPLEYVVFVGDPSHVTNMVERGQKAREHRWKKWLKKHERTAS